MLLECISINAGYTLSKMFIESRSHGLNSTSSQYINDVERPVTVSAVSRCYASGGTVSVVSRCQRCRGDSGAVVIVVPAVPAVSAVSRC